MLRLMLRFQTFQYGGPQQRAEVSQGGAHQSKTSQHQAWSLSKKRKCRDLWDQRVCRWVKWYGLKNYFVTWCRTRWRFPGKKTLKVFDLSVCTESHPEVTGSQSSEPRPTISKFSFFQDKEYTWTFVKTVKTLKGTKIAVANDHPSRKVGKSGVFLLKFMPMLRMLSAVHLRYKNGMRSLAGLNCPKHAYD